MIGVFTNLWGYFVLGYLIHWPRHKGSGIGCVYWWVDSSGTWVFWANFRELFLWECTIASRVMMLSIVVLLFISISSVICRVSFSQVRIFGWFMTATGFFGIGWWFIMRGTWWIARFWWVVMFFGVISGLILILSVVIVVLLIFIVIWVFWPITTFLMLIVIATKLTSFYLIHTHESKEHTWS